ncbi:MAG TPA: flagellar hook capping FlgD N-terminal domain-containing protein [Opitutaceae bacterium]|nr:flagellar hook capping FlgD N-terminal domain-containing protein [Opitutaceae bacterium]
MSVPPVGSSTNTSGANSAATAVSTKQQQVSLTEFMQLLSSEMSNQDPLQPMDPTQTMTQLAQFTSLQEMTSMSQTQGLATANSYLGQEVEVQVGSGANATTQTGTVLAVDSSGVASGGPPQLIISGLNQEYPLTSIKGVVSAAVANSASSTSSTDSSSSNSSTAGTNAGS